MFLPWQFFEIFEGCGIGDWKLRDREVHLWYGLYHDLDPKYGEIIRFLSNDEEKRSERFHSHSDRRNFGLRRGMLRILLARYLSMDPKDIRFGLNEYGKPFVKECNRENSLEFSTSHSKGMAIYAITRGRRLGADIEFIQPIPDMEAVVERFFSADEKAGFHSVPPHQWVAAFYHCWTQKEAFLKALGEGLSRGLDSFDVTVKPESPAALKGTSWDPEEKSRWTLKKMCLSREYASTIAVEGSDVELRCRQLKGGFHELVQ